MTYGSNWKEKNLKFDTSGGLIQFRFRFRYAENARALRPAKSLSPKFSVSISGGATADIVDHFSGKHQRDHFLVCPPRPQRMLKRGWPLCSAGLEKIRHLVSPKMPFANLPDTHKSRWGDEPSAEKMKECAWLRPVCSYLVHGSTIHKISAHAATLRQSFRYQPRSEQETSSCSCMCGTRCTPCPP